MDINRIRHCGDGFTASFCEVTAEKDVLRFRDDNIPDMYDHNYTVITPTDPKAVSEIITREIARNEKEGKDYCQVRIHDSVDIPALGLDMVPDITRCGFFVSEDPASLRLRARPGAAVKRINTMAQVEERIAIELDGYGEAHGRDFCVRKNRRNAEVYLPEGLVDSYICYEEKQPVGKADLYVQDGVAMIEDFDVIAAYQRKGYGTTILKHLVDIAIQRGADTVFMVTDMADTAKEMYEKIGFTHYPGGTSLFFRL